MRQFIVLRDPYTRYGSSEPFEMTLVEAETLNKLALKLLDPKFDGTVEQWVVAEQGSDSPFVCMKEGNGDGADYYLIKELKWDAGSGFWLEDILD